jgi:hypothetical protein
MAHIPKHPPSPPMTLGSMRQLGVHRLLVSCVRCRHEALVDVSNDSADMTVPSFIPRMKCSQCGGKRVDVRPNWEEQPVSPTRPRVDSKRED